MSRSLASTIRRAALFEALAQIAKKNSCRDILSDGSSIPIAISIDAQVRRASLHEDFCGHLLIGHSYIKASSSVCDQEHLLACCADLLGKERRSRHFREVLEYFAAKKSLPPVDKEVLAECSTLLADLRYRKKSETRGSVSFEFADDQE